MNYQELIGEYREVEQTKTLDEGTIRLYKILFAIQIVSLFVITGCALYIAYFG
jgi:hypothetical protein